MSVWQLHLQPVCGTLSKYLSPRLISHSMSKTEMPSRHWRHELICDRNESFMKQYCNVLKQTDGGARGHDLESELQSSVIKLKSTREQFEVEQLTVLWPSPLASGRFGSNCVRWRRESAASCSAPWYHMMNVGGSKAPRTMQRRTTLLPALT